MRPAPSSCPRTVLVTGMILVLLAMAGPAIAAGGLGGCCASDPCASPVRQSDCPNNNWSSCQKCNAAGKCVPDTDVYAWICKKGVSSDGACETDKVCKEGFTCTKEKSMPAPGKTAGDSSAAALCCGCEVHKPSCLLKASRSGPPAQIDIEVQDAESGLLTIQVTAAENADVAVPPFDLGTRDAVLITASKIDPGLASRVELRVTDLSLNTTTCDPVLVEVLRGTGRPASQSLPGIDASEHVVEVHNGAPGLHNLATVVNGFTFRVTGLADHETRTLDVSSAMLSGSHNIFTLTSYGKPGSSADVLIRGGAVDAD